MQKRDDQERKLDFEEVEMNASANSKMIAEVMNVEIKTIILTAW